MQIIIKFDDLFDLKILLKKLLFQFSWNYVNYIFFQMMYFSLCLHTMLFIYQNLQKHKFRNQQQQCSVFRKINACFSFLQRIMLVICIFKGLLVFFCVQRVKLVHLFTLDFALSLCLKCSMLVPALISLTRFYSEYI